MPKIKKSKKAEEEAKASPSPSLTFTEEEVRDFLSFLKLTYFQPTYTHKPAQARILIQLHDKMQAIAKKMEENIFEIRRVWEGKK